MSTLLERLKTPPFGTETSERALFAAAADRIEKLETALLPAAASLAAAISLLERSGKKAAASDKMFDIMLSDYRRALETVRAALKS